MQFYWKNVLFNFVKVDDDQEAWGEMWQVASHSPVEGEKDRKARNMRPRRERYMYVYPIISLWIRKIKDVTLCFHCYIKKKAQNSDIEWDRLHGGIEVLKLKIRNFAIFPNFY